MNYIVEGQINFNDILMQELCKENKKIKSEELCLISSNPLNNNYIELNCKHKFNYENILNEIINQKKKNNFLEIQRLKKNQIKCPYCRNIQNTILPYQKPYEKIKNVNWPPHLSMTNNKCTYKFKSGKRKGMSCNSGCMVYNNEIPYCWKHKNNNNQQSQMCPGIIKTGKNKGKKCRYKISTIDGFCKYHTHIDLCQENKSN